MKKKSGKEIERRWVLPKEPSWGRLHQLDCHCIDQQYLAVGMREVRLRVYGGGKMFTLTVKTGKGRERDEAEIALSQEQFMSLQPLAQDWKICKDRYDLPFGKHKLEIDIFKGRLTGLYKVECEFESSADAEAFKLPAWMKGVIEVTDDSRYNNQNLAVHGLPKDHPAYGKFKMATATENS